MTSLKPYFQDNSIDIWTKSVGWKLTELECVFFFNTPYIGIGAITGEVGGLYSKYYIEYRVKISLKINLGCTQVYATLDLNKANSNLGEGKESHYNFAGAKLQV